MPLIKITQELKQDIFEWDVHNWSRALDLWEQGIPGSPELNCLELGARSGGSSLWLALHGHRVICSDLQNPEDTAKSLHSKYNLHELIKYQAIDALDISYEDHFDVIIFKSIIGGISRDGKNSHKEQVFEQIAKALKPNGVLLFAENLRGSLIHKVSRKYFRKWGQSWNYMSKNELEKCLSLIGTFKIESTGFISAFTPDNTFKSVLLKIDQFLNPILPFDSKYVSYGYAIKQ